MSEQQVFTARRNYNRWVANQTLEDYALRFTAKSARRWSLARVSNTALGAISFLALEAIGGAITIHYGFDNALVAIIVVSAIILLTSIPISYYAARYGVDIDLLSRGAGFGYIGSTITSLIYASFTFIFFALEAAIMSSALQLLFGLPLAAGYLLSTLVIIPLATHGITFISRFQLWSQPLWVVLQLAPFVFILYHEWSAIRHWTDYPGLAPTHHAGTSLIYVGAASGVLFSLIAQIGEQVDFLRFLPVPNAANKRRWWVALMSAGPGWILLGAVKILAGSFLAVLAVRHGVPEGLADDPIQMYLVAFSYLTQSPQAALALAGIFVIVCQLKINVTNAYAGSIAWSNFFSRLSHSHPGRVVWLIFNVVIALLLMELGVYGALENILGIYSILAVAWVGALVADLVVNKPLGFSPKHIEFKRAHLYDINPVGVGAMLAASAVGILSYLGIFGNVASALAPYLALLTAFVTSPLIAIGTGGKYYIARQPHVHAGDEQLATCKICQNEFEVEDMTSCPAYDGSICSLCCSIDARCHDQCKAGARFGEQLIAFVAAILPHKLASRMEPRLLQFLGLLVLIGSFIATLLWIVFNELRLEDPAAAEMVASVLVQVFFMLLIVIGVLVWLFVLASESRQFALNESQRQTYLLRKEIKAHERTDAALQQAKEAAESANLAKTRYLTGISHELRSPLNSILGYAQLLEKDRRLLADQHNKVGLIRRSGDHLADLIEGLLDISRIEAGRLEIHRDQVLLQGMLAELTEMFRLQAEAKGIRFDYQTSGALPEVVIADEKHLRQILINLLSNAVKYTEKGSVSLSVRYRSQVAEFTVTDTGVGIEADAIERIFEPFERIRKPGGPQSPGTGLGLTISKFLTEIMGGEIDLQSAPGKGSTFKLSLLLSSVASPTLRTEPERTIASYKGATQTLMVVDDDASHRGLISEILTPLGFRVIEAEDSLACLELLKHTDIDLFLLDISMPGMSGWELLKTLRENDATTPVIMVSADATEEPEQACLYDDGTRMNNDYIIKPVRDNLLLDKIARVLDLQWHYAQDARRPPDNDNTSSSTTASSDFDCVAPSDCRELAAMAELGFISGVEDTLARMQQRDGNTPFIATVRRHLERYQFEQIVTLSKRKMS